MAINDNQKLDWLWKKLGYNVAKTDINSQKNATNENIPSPLLLRGDNLWTDAVFIPSSKPTSSSRVVEIYDDTGGGRSTVETTMDTTSRSNRTWKTNITNWIPPQFGSTYQVKVYLDTAGAANPQSTGTQLFAAGSGNNDEWFFDYDAGVLNFIGDNLPSGFNNKVIYIAGAAYIGKLGNNFKVINADSAQIGHMFADSVDIHMADIVTAYIDSADIIHAFIDSARIDIARIDSAVITDLHANTGFISQLSGDSANITNITTSKLYAPLIQGPGEIIIDPLSYRESDGSGNITDSGRSGQLTILGNLQVEGTQTVVNSTVVTVNDKNLVLGDSSQSATMSDGGGIILDLGNDGTAEIVYRSVGDKWELNKPLHVGHLDADSANIRSFSSDSAVIERGHIKQFTADSGFLSRIDIDSGFANHFNIDSTRIRNAVIEEILTVDGTGKFNFVDADSALIGKLRVENFKLLGVDSFRFLMVDSQGNMNTDNNFTANKTVANFYQGGMTINSQGDVQIGRNLTLPTTTIDAGGITTPMINAQRMTLTSLEPGALLLGGAQDSFSFTDDLTFKARASNFTSVDGFNVGFEPIQDSGYYYFNVDKQSGRILGKGGLKVGRFNNDPQGQYIQNYPYDKGANTRTFFGIDLELDSGKLVSTAYRNIFKSPRLTSMPNNDSFDVIDVMGLGDSTLFQVKADGSINFSGNILKNGQIFSGGGIFTKDEASGDAQYVPNASILDPAQNPGVAQTKNAFGFGRVALNSTTPKYGFSVDGTFAAKGAIDSAKTEYVLVPGFENGGTVFGDDSDLSRMFFIPTSSILRAGVQDSIGMNRANMGMFSIGLGYKPQALGKSSIAMGWGSKALGAHAIAIGHKNTTGSSVNTGGIVIGIDNRLDSTPGQAQDAIGIGTVNKIKGDRAKIFGGNNIIAGEEAGIFGNQNVMGDSASTTNTGNAAGSYIIGNINQVGKAGGAFVMGFSNTVTDRGNASYTIGNNNTMDGPGGITLGTQNQIRPTSGIAIGNVVTVDSTSNFSIGINLSNSPMTVKDPNIMSIQGGNVSIGADSDKFAQGGGYDPEGNLYVSGDIVIGGRYLAEGASGSATTASPWDDDGTIVSTNLGNRRVAINKTTAHQTFEVLSQGGATLAMGQIKTPDVAFPGGIAVSDSDMFDSSNTNRSLLSYIPKARVFRAGSFTRAQLLDSNVGYGSFVLGPGNVAAGKDQFVIGIDNRFHRGHPDEVDSFGSTYDTFNTTRGQRNIIIGHGNIGDSAENAGDLNIGSNHIILGSNNRISGNASDNIIIGKNATIGSGDSTSDRIYIHHASSASDSSLNNTKVTIGKSYPTVPSTGPNKYGNYALDVHGDIHIDSGATLYIGNATINEHVGLGSVEDPPQISGGLGGLLSTIVGTAGSPAIANITTNGSGHIVVTTVAPHQISSNSPNLAISFQGIIGSVDSVNGVDSINFPNFYFPDVLDATRFRLLHDSPGSAPFGGLVQFNPPDGRGPDLVGNGIEQANAGGLFGSIQKRYWTKPAILPADFTVKGDLNVVGKSLNLEADSAGLRFTATGNTANTAYYTFDSSGPRINRSVLGLGEISLDSYVLRAGDKGGLIQPHVVNTVDTDYVQARVSADANFVIGAQELFFKPSAGQKPVQIGLGPTDVGVSDPAGNKFDYAMHLAALSNQGAINIHDSTNLIGAGAFTGTGGVRSPITINGQPFPTMSYLSQAGMVDQTYINSLVRIDSVALSNFIDEAYLKGIIDSTYIMSAANDSTDWQRQGDKLFFGTFPNVENVQVGIGTSNPTAKFEVAGHIKGDSATFSGPLHVEGDVVTRDSEYTFTIDRSYLVENLQSASKRITGSTNPTLQQTLVTNQTAQLTIDLLRTPERFFEVYRIDLNGDSQPMIEGTHWDFSTPGTPGRFILVNENAFDSNDSGTVTDLEFFARDARPPNNFILTGNDDTKPYPLDYNTSNVQIDLLDSTGAIKFANYTDITASNSGTLLVGDSSIISLRDKIFIRDRSAKRTSSLTVVGDINLDGNLISEADNKVTFVDSVQYNTILRDTRTGTMKLIGEFHMDSGGAATGTVTDGVKGRDKFKLDGLTFQGNIEDIVDSNYIGTRNQGVWNQATDSFGIQKIYYERGGTTGAVLIGPLEDWPGQNTGGMKDQLGQFLGQGDSDTKLYVSRGNVIFSANDTWDSAGVATTTQNVVPNLKRAGGPRFMWIPKRGALRAGVIDGTTTKWNDEDIGRASIGLGYNAKAFDFSTAIGYQVTAGFETTRKRNSVTVGKDIANPSEAAVAVGRQITHSSIYGENVSVGIDLSATSGSSNLVVGKDNSVTYSNSVAVGLDVRSVSSGVIVGRGGSTYTGVSVGTDNSATYGYSVSVGYASSSAYGSVSIGNNVYSAYGGGVSIGKSVTSVYSSGLAIGRSINTSVSSTNIGDNLTSSYGNVLIGKSQTGVYSTTLIGKNQSGSYSAVLIGRDQSSGGYSGLLAVGVGNVISYGSVAIGHNNTMNGYGGSVLAIGRNNTNLYRGSVAIGQNNTNAGWGNVSIGRDNIYNGYQYGGAGVVVGLGNEYTGFNNKTGQFGGGHAIFGRFNTYNASGNIFGASNRYNRQVNIWGNENNNIEDGGNGYIYGTGNRLFRGGMLYGQSNKSGNGGYAFGVSNYVTDNGLAFGADNTVKKVAYAFGYSNTVSDSGGTGINALAFGYSNTANTGGIAFGENNTVSNRGQALGNQNTASGNRSLAIGSGITVSGDNSVGIGLHVQNSGTVSANNTLAILGGKVGVNQATVGTNYLMEVAGNFNIPGPSDYYRHGKRLEDYIKDDVANFNYITKDNADSAYVQSAVDIAYLRSPTGPMSPNFFFASNISTNNLRYLGGHQVGVGKEPGTIMGLNSPNPRLDVDGAINFTDALYLSGTKVIPSIDSIGDVYISHNPQNFFIGPDSATEVFDSDYVFDRQATFGMGRFDSIQNTVTANYINQRIDQTLFLDSAEANALIAADRNENVAFQFEPGTGRVSLTSTDITNAIGAAPFGVKVGIGTNADFANTLKVEGNTLINNGQLLLNGTGAGIFINGVELEPVSPWTDGFAYVTYDGTKNIGIQKATPLVELDVGGTINAENIQINGNDLITGIFDSNYIQARTLRFGDGAGLDSAMTSRFVDSDYVKLRADSDYIKTAADSDWIKHVADSAYIFTAADSDYIKTVATRAYIRSHADSDYVKTVATRTYIRSHADSDYIKTAADRTWIRFNADSNYIKSAADQTWIRLNADSDYIKSAANRDWIRLNADSNYILSAADSDYVKTVVDSAYAHLLTGIGQRDVVFSPHKVFYKNSVAQTVDLPNATSNEGNIFIDQQRDNKPYIGRNGSWQRIGLAADIDSAVDSAVSVLIDAAPGTLDTLNELAAALGDDPNFATTITNSIATKLAIADFNSTFDTRLSGKSTDDLSEGASNLYYTNARFDTRFGSKSTTDLTEGSNLYYTQGRFNTAFSAKSTTDLSEGTNLYYTDTRFDTRLASKSTTDLSEGTNLYYTDTRFDTRLASKSTTDLSEGTNLYYTDTRARNAISGVDAGGDGSFSYNSSTGAFTYTGPSPAEVRAHFSAGGDLTYDSATGKFQFDVESVYTKANFDSDLGLANTGQLPEGSNLYYTDARVRAAISENSPQLTYNSATGVITYTQGNTDSVPEGSTNLYYTTARVDAHLAGSSVTIDGNGSTGGVIVSDGNIAVKTGTGNVAAIDFYCEVNNAHRVRLKAPAHASFSGNPDVTLPNASGTLALLTDVAGSLDSAEAIQLIDSAYIAARTPPALTVREVDSADGVNKEITGVSAINFDNFTGFQVDSTSTPGEVKVSLGSGFKTISVTGQSDIVAIGEDTLKVGAANGIKLTTDASNKILNIGVDSNFTTLDSAGVLGIVDSAYINNIIMTSGSGGTGTGGSSKLANFDFIATEGQTSFTGFNYTKGGLLVTVNGVAFTRGTDYTANTGTSIVFASGRDSGDEVSVYTNVAVSGSNINDSADVTSSAATVIDQVAHTGDFKSVEYTIHMSEATLNHTQITKVLVTYNKTNVNMTEYGVINSFSGDSDFGVIEADENGGNIRLKLTRASGLGNIKVKTNKTIL